MSGHRFSSLFFSVLLLPALCALVLAAAPARADDIDYEKDAPGYEACMAEAYNTRAMLDCMQSAYEFWDGVLNRNYKTTMNDCAELSGDAQCKDKIRKAQRLWVLYKEAMSKAFGAMSDGTSASLAAMSFLVETTKAQARYLSN